MSLVVKAKIKEYAKTDGKQLNVAGDFADALSVEVEKMIVKACKRAVDNNRSTVMSKDL